MPDDTRDLRIERRLDQWAAASPARDAKRLVNDLAGLYRAAHHVTESIEALSATGADAPVQARAFNSIETWLYDELLDYAQSMRDVLDTVTSQTYEHVPDGELGH